ncbi:MAG TPA: GNAT family N-acetyltransferase [Enteractinococcus helveticum]|uniref:GNAT family N-acetyltransferase n=1 Tax=Enteractinococcus helveticum TaxID=1837282 RepID=A0A921FNQ7_9MICC|nr:GNAT family N-acetyltransferase [Enteractinococcus helveticum]HJF15044.1 GNAT family N-acetyltransferase [Enteractinococcus helveticum]
MVSITIRALQPEEHDVLIRAAVDNFNWDVERFTSHDVLASPEMVRYTEFIPRRGDFGFIALDKDTPVGLAWVLFLPHGRRSWGFAESEIPEVSLWVETTFRGRGVGGALLRATQRMARRRDLPGLSLAVDPDNPVRELYRKEGFEDVVDTADDGVMVWRQR